MGAFGELLIQTWGGDLDRYRGNYQTESNKEVNETTELDKEKFRNYRKLSMARDSLSRLTSELMYKPQDVNLYTEDSVKNGFKRLGYDEGIQNVMWSEYSAFISKYIIKDIRR